MMVTKNSLSNGSNDSTENENDKTSVAHLLAQMRQRQKSLREALDRVTLAKESKKSGFLSPRRAANSNLSDRMKRLHEIRTQFEAQCAELRKDKENAPPANDAPKKRKPSTRKKEKKKKVLGQPTQNVKSSSVKVSHDLKSQLRLPLHTISATNDDECHLQRPQSAIRYCELDRRSQDVEQTESENGSLTARNFTQTAVLNSARGEVKDEEHLMSRYLDMQQLVEQRMQEIKNEQKKKKNLQRCGARKKVKKSGERVQLCNDNFFCIFEFLDAISLAKLNVVSSQWKMVIGQATRCEFGDLFGKYPTNVPSKTIFWVLRRAHFLNVQHASQLYFWSCARGYVKFVRDLIEDETHHWLVQFRHGINAVCKKDGMSALHIASKHKQMSILELLLEQEDLKINKLTKSGRHAIQIATEQSANAVVRLLLTHPEIDLTLKDNDERSVLHMACLVGNQEIVKLLLEHDADPNVIDKELRTPLYLAAEQGFTNICEILIDVESVDINQASKSGKTPLYAAAERNHPLTVRLFLLKGADVRQETCRQKIPLYSAAEQGFVEVVRELLPYTAQKDLFRVTHYGTTVMFIASKHPNKTVKNMLVSFCMNRKNARKRTKEFLERRHSDTISKEERVQAEMELAVQLDAELPTRQSSETVRASTPRFAEQFEMFQEFHRKRRKTHKPEVLTLDNDTPSTDVKTQKTEVEAPQQTSKPTHKPKVFQTTRPARNVAGDRSSDRPSFAQPWVSRRTTKVSEDPETPACTQTKRTMVKVKGASNIERKSPVKNTMSRVTQSKEEDEKDQEETPEVVTESKTNESSESMSPKTTKRASESDVSSEETSQGVKPKRISVGGTKKSEKKYDGKWNPSVKISQPSVAKVDEAEADELLEEPQEKKVTRNQVLQFVQRQSERVSQARAKAIERLQIAESRAMEERDEQQKRREHARMIASKVAARVKKRRELHMQLTQSVDENVEEDSPSHSTVSETQNVFENVRKQESAAKVKRLHSEPTQIEDLTNRKKKLEQVLEAMAMKRSASQRTNVELNPESYASDGEVTDLLSSHSTTQVEVQARSKSETLHQDRKSPRRSRAELLKKRRVRKALLRSAYGVSINKSKSKQLKTKSKVGSDDLVRLLGVGSVKLHSRAM